MFLDSVIRGSQRFLMRYHPLVYALVSLPCIIGLWHLSYCLSVDFGEYGIKQIFPQVPIALFDPYWVICEEYTSALSGNSWLWYYAVIAIPLSGYVLVLALFARTKWFRAALLIVGAVHLVMMIAAYLIVSRPVLKVIW